MSKITNDGLTRSGTGCFIAAVPIWQQWASRVNLLMPHRSQVNWLESYSVAATRDTRPLSVSVMKIYNSTLKWQRSHAVAINVASWQATYDKQSTCLLHNLTAPTTDRQKLEKLQLLGFQRYVIRQVPDIYCLSISDNFDTGHYRLLTEVFMHKEL